MDEEKPGAGASDLSVAVKDALGRVAGISEEQIAVRVSGSVVYLIGSAGSHRQKLQAERAAGQVPGVRAVMNELRVALQIPRPDEELLHEVRAALAADARVAAVQLQVDVRDGVVYLEGEAHDPYARWAAEDCAWSVPGIREVHNGIIVLQDTGASDAAFAADLAAAVASNLGLTGWHVSVTVQQRVTYLQGMVPTEDHRWRVEEVVRWHGALDVVNQLQVPSGPVGHDQFLPGLSATPQTGPSILSDANGSGSL